MNIEGVKKEFAKSMVSQATEEYNKLDYVDKIDNDLILTGLFTYNMMDCLMNGKIATEPTKAIARLMKVITAMEKRRKRITRIRRTCSRKKRESKN